MTNRYIKIKEKKGGRDETRKKREIEKKRENEREGNREMQIKGDVQNSSENA